jgi:hypothetical protein
MWLFPFKGGFSSIALVMNLTGCQLDSSVPGWNLVLGTYETLYFMQAERLLVSQEWFCCMELSKLAYMLT